jgi:plasmid stability protein
MSTLTVRNLDDGLKARLRVRAAENGRSMESEVRAILRSTLVDEAGTQDRLGTRIRERFVGLRADTLDLPPRRDLPRAADLSG